MARSRILHTNLDHIWRNLKDLPLSTPSRRFRPDDEDGVVEIVWYSFVLLDCHSLQYEEFFFISLLL